MKPAPTTVDGDPFVARAQYTARTADPHVLYEKAVQCPEADVRFLSRVFRRTSQREALTLREDFCGTSLLCAEWVRSRKDREAYGVDLDGDVLEWGRVHNIEPLGEKGARVHLKQADVLVPKKPRVDIQVAFNFSYCIFKDRATILRYFRAAHRSLADDGIFVLDIHGGPEAFDAVTEEKSCKGFTYIWEQGPFSPVTHERTSYIHFRFPDRTKLRRAFTYDWRIWTCPEISDLLTDAGFAGVDVHWEGTDRETNAGNGVYRLTKHGENCPSWIAYIVAINGRR
jgi:SAM-dependent methyltransferase